MYSLVSSSKYCSRCLGWTCSHLHLQHEHTTQDTTDNSITAQPCSHVPVLFVIEQLNIIIIVFEVTEPAAVFPTDISTAPAHIRSRNREYDGKTEANIHYNYYNERQRQIQPRQAMTHMAVLWLHRQRSHFNKAFGSHAVLLSDHTRRRVFGLVTNQYVCIKVGPGFKSWSN